MARVVVTSAADADTCEIQTYLARNAGAVVASRYTMLFERLYERLAEYPDSGALRPALGHNIRVGVVAPFIVMYRHERDADTVTVLRIVHGRRRIAGNLLSD
jgi:toxin ParE1/3/4